MSTGQKIPVTPNFLWGASTAAHQIEGGNTGSDWWMLEHVPNTFCVESSGDASDSYHRYGEDIQLLADAGLNTYRFSIEWARIEPAEGEFSKAQLLHYRRMIDTCLAAGITPLVTLHHFTSPLWFTARGGWNAPGAVDAFGRYVSQAATILTDVPYVVTINEPNIFAMMIGAMDLLANLPETDLTDSTLSAAALPPPSEAASQVLADAHRRAVEILGSVGGTDSAKTGWTVANQVFQAAPGFETECAAYSYPREDFFLEVSRTDDFVGVQSYTRTIIGEDGPLPTPEDGERTLTGWEYYPAALGEALRHTQEWTNNVPMIVTENGIATSDDARRIDYTRGALAGMADAMNDGAKVDGYLHWSLLDNFEWANGYAPTFGLISWDRETFARTPKPSLSWLGQVAKTATL